MINIFIDKNTVEVDWVSVTYSWAVFNCISGFFFILIPR